jgi:hypothetical protein
VLLAATTRFTTEMISGEELGGHTNYYPTNLIDFIQNDQIRFSDFYHVSNILSGKEKYRQKKSPSKSDELSII